MLSGFTFNPACLKKIIPHTRVHGSTIHNAKRWKQPYWPLAGEWINTTWYMHAMECYSALKRKEILVHATTWMNLEDLMLIK